MTEGLKQGILAVLEVEFRTCPLAGGGVHRCYPLSFEAMHELREAFRKEPPERDVCERERDGDD